MSAWPKPFMYSFLTSEKGHSEQLNSCELLKSESSTVTEQKHDFGTWYSLYYVIVLF